MELEKDLLNALISYLRERGYPTESFAIEFPVDKKGRRRVDLAVLNPDTQQPIALFELKERRTPSAETTGRRQLEIYLSALEVKSIPTYLVFSRIGTPPFEIVQVSIPEEKITEAKEEVKFAGIPSYEILVNSERNASLPLKKNAYKRQVDGFTAVSLILASFVFGLLVAVLRRQLSISATELTLLVIFVGLVLLPWASRIKFAGIEFERMKKRERSEN